MGTSLVKTNETVAVKSILSHATFLNIGQNTKLVHLRGFPFLWAIKKVLKRAPNLVTLCVAPGNIKDLREQHKEVCKARGVTIRTMPDQPNMSWSNRENIGSKYKAQKKLLLDLEGKKTKLFDELILLDFTAAKMTSRYYCLNGENYISQFEVGIKYGFNGKSATALSNRRIKSVLKYLSPNMKVSKEAAVMADTIAKRVLEKRAVISQKDERATLLSSLNLTEKDIPSGLKWSRIHIFAKLFHMYNAGEITPFKSKTLRLGCEILIQRFGLRTGKCRTLEEIGQTYHLTCERIRQIETLALEALGLIEE